MILLNQPKEKKIDVTTVFVCSYKNESRPKSNYMYMYILYFKETFFFF